MTASRIGSIAQGGIIAAGQGVRLRSEGWTVSKAMVPVGGRPLIEHTVERFRAVGIHRLTVIINESSSDCRERLEQLRSGVELDLVIKDTPTSYASFRTIVERLAPEPALITTVDCIVPISAFRTFVTTASSLPGDAVILGLTEHDDDDSPLRATLDPATGRITRLGGDRGTHVTAGLYVLPARRQTPALTAASRLRDYLAWLVNSGHPVHGVVLPRVFDIDRTRDIASAEAALREGEWASL